MKLMKNVVSLAVLGLITGSPLALASSVSHLNGQAADDFIEKHFPNAEIPGAVEGKFTYVSGMKTGYADCFFPAMGEASDGVETGCTLTEGTKHLTLNGDAADDFIEKYFPNADIPGSVKGKFIYSAGVKKTGYAKCFVPAMGEASNGVEASCDVTY
jgi:hypothetical protein